MIRIEKYSELSPEVKSQLNHYIDKAFGHVPFVQQHTWADPDWTVLLYEGDELATFYNIVEREVIMDGAKYKIAGINNVITPEQHRGRGYSTKALKETEAFLFNDLKADYGLLVCADALLPFYSRLNWYATDSQVYYEQPDGKKLFDSNTMLLSPPGKPALHPEVIDLNGLPW